MLIVFGLPQRCHSWRCCIISSERHSCHWAMSNTSLGYLRFKQTVELLTHPLLTCKYKREWPAGPRAQLQRVAIREKRERNNWLRRENRQNKKRNEPHSSILGQHKEAKCNCVLGKKKTNKPVAQVALLGSVRIHICTQLGFTVCWQKSCGALHVYEDKVLYQLGQVENKQQRLSTNGFIKLCYYAMTI